jgi:hypothetical protein
VKIPPEMKPASDSTTALLICDGSSSEAIGGGGETVKGAGHQGRLCTHLRKAASGHHHEPPSHVHITNRRRRW